MNIAIFSPNQNPYSETFIQAHKNYLKGNIYYYYGPLNNITLEDNKLISFSSSRLLQLQKQLFNKSQNWYSFNRLLKSLKSNSIHAILVEYGAHAHQLLPILKASNIPFVVHFHGYDASVTKVLKQCSNYSEVFRSAFKIISVSNRMSEMLLDLGCPKEKLVYNVYGPRPEFFDVVPTFSKMQFLSVGRFTDKKAPYYLIMSIKLVVKTYPDIKLIMAGSGPLLNMCKNLVKYWDLSGNVVFPGVINAETYKELLGESLAYVQHSIIAENGDMEGTPLSILEASIAGLPVISTYHAGIPDVVIHKETGLLSDEHDIEQMSNHMIAVIEDKDLAMTLGQNGKSNIQKHFNLKRHIDQLQTILDSVLV